MLCEITPPHAMQNRTVGEVAQRAVLIQLLHNQHYFSLFFRFLKFVVVRFAAKVVTYQNTAQSSAIKFSSLITFSGYFNQKTKISPTLFAILPTLSGQKMPNITNNRAKLALLLRKK